MCTVELFLPISFMFLGDISTKVKLKYCAGGCQSRSINLGITLSVHCDADLCNVQDAPGIVLY